MRILYVATICATVNAFFKQHIKMLLQEGHSVDIASNGNEWPLDSFYYELGCGYYQVDFSRLPLSWDNLRAYRQLKKIIAEGNYDIVHCHTPNAAAITRLVCRKFRKKNGLKVFYTAHGFHFFKGAPKLNWMVFYPIEKLCSRFTDKLITINQEDYQLAKTKFKVKEVHYVPGVGIDLNRFENVQVNCTTKRQEIGIPRDAFFLMSVGELNENKNHQIIIKALAKLNNPNVHYAIAGVGDQFDYLLALAGELGISSQVHLLGYRKDIPELNYSADAFCFPSLREGLGVAAIEAMACGLPILTSNVHGINDYSQDGVTGYKFPPMDEDAFARGIRLLIDHDDFRASVRQNNITLAKQFDVASIVSAMRQIYGI